MDEDKEDSRALSDSLNERASLSGYYTFNARNSVKHAKELEAAIFVDKFQMEIEELNSSKMPVETGEDGATPSWYDASKQHFRFSAMPKALIEVFKNAGITPKDLNMSHQSQKYFDILHESGIGSY